MPSGLMCIECMFVRENQEILARFEYSSIDHTSSEYKQPSHEDQKAIEQVTVKKLVYLEFGS